MEQFVGLMLDKSKGAPTTLGAELVTNGDFGNGTTGWSAGGSTTLSVSSGVMRATGTTDGAFFGQQVLFAANTWYKLTFSSLSDGTSKAAQINLGTTLGSSNRYAGSIAFGTNRTIYYYSSAAETLWMWFYPGFFGTTNYILIDDVSCKVAFGNHATSTGTKRPKLAARYNLLTYSEQFDNAVWGKSNSSVTANAAVAPDGTTTADKLIDNAVNTDHRINFGVVSVTAGISYRSSVYAKAAERSQITMWESVSGVTRAVLFDLVAGTVTDIVGSGLAASSFITSVGSGWFRCGFTITVTNAAGVVAPYITLANAGAYIYTGDGTSGAFIWGADLRPTSQATGLIGPTYQRVVDAATYDTAGFLPYLQFDGIDDSMSTGSIDPGAIDKAQVFAGVRKLSDVAIGVINETSANAGSNNGSLSLTAAGAGSAGAKYGTALRGTTLIFGDTATSYTAPITNVLTEINDIAQSTAATEQILRINGAQASLTFGGADAGTGNFGNYPLYLGGRGGTSLYFNGWLSSLIVRFGPNLSQSQIEATESWVNQRTGAY